MTTQDPETWMWQRARAMLDQAERLHRGTHGPGRPGTKRPSWEPPADVFETATELWVLVALPGVAPEDIQVELDGTALTVKGGRRIPPAFRQAAVHRLEIPHGRFERTIDLPPGTYEVTRSEVAHGCLYMNLAKID